MATLGPVAHVIVEPVVPTVGLGLTVTISLHVLLLPEAVIVTLIVNEPAAPAVTETVEPVAEPTIVPLPLIDHRNVGLVPSVVALYVSPVWFAHAGTGPGTPQEG